MAEWQLHKDVHLQYLKYHLNSEVLLGIVYSPHILILFEASRHSAESPLVFPLASNL